MRNLISPDAVAEAVLDLAEPSGPRAVTARALAGHLNVSVGALYNYAGSMQNAFDAAEEIIAGRMASSLDSTSLIAWIAENRGHASLLFDLERPHPGFSPEASQSLLSAVGLTAGPSDTAAESVRSLIGLLINDPATGEIIDDLPEWQGLLLGAWSRAESRRAAGEKADIVSVSADELMAAIHGVIDDAPVDDVRRAVRHTTIDVLSAGLDRGWNFREMASRTSLPLARLHTMGTRNDHLVQAVVDLVDAGSRLADAAGASRAVALTSLPAMICTLPDSFIAEAMEVLSLTSIRDIQDRTGITETIAAMAAEHPNTVSAQVPPGLATVAMIGPLLSAFMHRAEHPDSWASAPDTMCLLNEEFYREL